MTAAPAPAASCQPLLTAATPAPTPAATPKLAALVAKVGRRQPDSIAVKSGNCVGTVNPPQVVGQIISIRIRPSVAGTIYETVANHPTEVRLVGGQAYVYLRQLAARDRGRPWLSVSIERAGAAIGLNLSELLNRVPHLNPSQNPLLLRGTKLFQSLGQATVDGRRVDVYRATFDPGRIPQSVLPADLVQQIQAQMRVLGANREVVTSYLTPAGVSLRMVTELANGSRLLTVDVVDTLALNQPVHVSAPPASRTIAYDKLVKR